MCFHEKNDFPNLLFVIKDSLFTPIILDRSISASNSYVVILFFFKISEPFFIVFSKELTRFLNSNYASKVYY